MDTTRLEVYKLDLEITKILRERYDLKSKGIYNRMLKAFCDTNQLSYEDLREAVLKNNEHLQPQL